jgi:hypothetical protein
MEPGSQKKHTISDTVRDAPEELTSASQPKEARTPGRFKGRLVVGPEFFEPLSDEELRELTAE